MWRAILGCHIWGKLQLPSSKRKPWMLKRIYTLSDLTKNSLMLLSSSAGTETLWRPLCSPVVPRDWQLCHLGANESGSSSSGLHLELPVRVGPRLCRLHKHLVILMLLYLRDTGRCFSLLFCFKKIWILFCHLAFFFPCEITLFPILQLWLASRTPLCSISSVILWTKEVLLWEVICVFWPFMLWRIGLCQHGI